MKLQSPITIGGLELKDQVLMAPVRVGMRLASSRAKATTWLVRRIFLCLLLPNLLYPKIMDSPF